jgi:N-acetylglucosaminyl-diphospho-decaprenol L-rhamnosyltransferase
MSRRRVRRDRRGYSRRVDEQAGTSSRVSVVVITRDRRSELMESLARLLALPERPPVLLVDNDSSDGTADAVEQRFPTVDVVRLPRNLGAAGRTVGVRRARTPYVAFSDDDSWWAGGALERAADTLDRAPRLAVLAARILVREEGRLDPVCLAMRNSPLGEVAGVGPRVLGFVACGAVVRRSAYLEVGGFHPRFGVGGEERLLAVDLAERGWDCAYAEDVVAHHHPSEIRDLAARRARDVRNALWTLWLRRRLPVVLRQTGGLLARAARDRDVRAGMRQALVGGYWVLRERATVRLSTERALRRLGDPL